MMISYLKIYGPPLLKAIKTLETIAIDMPTVCIMNTRIKLEFGGIPDPSAPDDIRTFFKPVEIEEERCRTIISRSGQKLGDYDFFFEWAKKPSVAELNDLIGKIDKALTPLGCRYTITTK